MVYLPGHPEHNEQRGALKNKSYDCRENVDNTNKQRRTGSGSQNIVAVIEEGDAKPS